MTVTLFSLNSFAQDNTTDTATTKGAKTAKIEKMIEEKYNVKAEDVAKLRDQKLGYGQIIMALEISKVSGKSMDEVTGLLKEKKSIAQVAKELNLSKEDMQKIRNDIRPIR